MRCPHNSVTAVINPSSVGRVPMRLFLYKMLDHTHSHPPLSDTWTRISQMRGNACQRVRCSHKCVIAVNKPSSVGSEPDKPKSYKLLSPSPTSHHHVNNPGVYGPAPLDEARELDARLLSHNNFHTEFSPGVFEPPAEQLRRFLLTWRLSSPIPLGLRRHYLSAPVRLHSSAGPIVSPRPRSRAVTPHLSMRETDSAPPGRLPD